MNFLGIDIGTTATKVFLVKDSGLIVSSQAPNELLHPKTGWVEQDPKTLLKNVMHCLGQVSANNNAFTKVSITNQRETIIPVEKSTGKALYNAISWMDVRTSDICEEFAQKPGSQAISKLTGLKFSPFFSVFKMIWLLGNVEAVRVASATNNLIFCTIDSWILKQLTQSRSYFTDMTNASRTMLMDLDTLAYSQVALEFFGISSDFLPDICPSLCDDFGRIADGLPFANMAVNVLIGDQQSSLLGHWGRAFKNQAKCTFGTGAFLLKSVDAVDHSDANYLWTVLNLGSDSFYLQEYPIVCAGSLVNWLQKTLEMIPSVDDLNSLDISLYTPEESVYFCPNLSGCLFPLWNSSRSGSFHNLTLKTTKADLCQSVLEAVAYSIRLALERKDISVLSIDGGMSSNPIFCRLLADICQIKIRVLACPDATCMGAIALSSGFAIDTMSGEQITAPHSNLSFLYDQKFLKWKRYCGYQE